MRRLEIKRQMSPDDVADVTELLAAAERADGRRALDDHQWLDLVRGGRRGFAGLLASEPGRPHPVAYAQLSRGNRSWTLELVIDPDRRYEADTIGPEMLGAALDVIRSEGGGHVNWWVFEPTPVHVRLATRFGLHPGRELHQMRRPLPVAEPFEIETRPFVVGRDEHAWLTVNNRAFRDHPEQGGWDLATLQARQREPWFDAGGFLLHEVDGALAGFCWTKIHRDHDPVLGEIYVIAVDPAFHGRGLGRSLTLAGLDSLHRRGVAVGMLYVDADNEPAVRLYQSLDFTVHRTDRAFVGDITSENRPAD